MSKTKSKKDNSFEYINMAIDKNIKNKHKTSEKKEKHVSQQNTPLFPELGKKDIIID